MNSTQYRYIAYYMYIAHIIYILLNHIYNYICECILIYTCMIINNSVCIFIYIINESWIWKEAEGKGGIRGWGG